MYKRCEIVKMWTVNLYCDDCGEHISNCGKIRTANSGSPLKNLQLDVWWEYTCPQCGKVTIADKHYPIMTYAFASDGEEVDKEGVLIQK